MDHQALLRKAEHSSSSAAALLGGCSRDRSLGMNSGAWEITPKSILGGMEEEKRSTHKIFLRENYDGRETTELAPQEQNQPEAPLNPPQSSSVLPLSRLK